MPTTKPKTHRDLANDKTLVGRLMVATQFSAYAIQRHLRHGTRPVNPIIAKAWDAAIAEVRAAS